MSTAASTAAAAPSVRHTVLIVDDEAPIRAAIRRALRDEPYELLEADGGEAALAIIKSRQVDALVVDNAMPGMSGLDLLRIARMTRPDAIRIMLTGRAELDTAIRAINEDGVFRFLCKPWERDALRLTVRLALARHDQDAQTERLLKIAGPSLRKLQSEAAPEVDAILDVERDEEGRIVIPMDDDDLA